MATVYNIDIQSVSDWVAYPTEEVEKEIKAFLESKTELGMTCVEVKAKITA